MWKDGSLIKLQRNGITNQMYTWIRSYLHNQRARVDVNDYIGKEFSLRHGVPQKGTLSPALFNIFKTSFKTCQRELNLHSMLLTWSCGVRKNASLQQPTEGNKQLTNWQRGEKSGMLPSTRKNHQQPYLYHQLNPSLSGKTWRHSIKVWGRGVISRNHIWQVFDREDSGE